MVCDLCNEEIEDGELKAVGEAAIIDGGEEVNHIESEVCGGCIKWVHHELMGKTAELVPVPLTGSDD